MAEQEKEKTDAEQTAEKTVTAEASAGSAEQTAGTEPEPSKEAAAGPGTQEADPAAGGKDEAQDTPEQGEDNEDTGKAGKSIFRRDKEKEKLKDQVKALQDQTMRQMAEFDNYRKRTDKEKEQSFSNGEKSVLEKILPILDNFERGFETVDEEDREDAFVQGMRKVYDQMTKQLTDLGVTPIDAVGKDFDPQLHNAVMQEDSDELESGKVCRELQKGYMYHDTVLRHSMVSVVQ